MGAADKDRENRAAAGSVAGGVDIGRDAAEPTGTLQGGASGQTRADWDGVTTRNVDARALRRILTWALEACMEQQSLIHSAMEIVSGAQQGSAQPTHRHQSPGAQLRATLAELQRKTS